MAKHCDITGLPTTECTCGACEDDYSLDPDSDDEREILG